MEMKHFVTALENISCLIAQVIGAMEGEMAKKMPGIIAQNKMATPGIIK